MKHFPIVHQLIQVSIIYITYYILYIVYFIFIIYIIYYILNIMYYILYIILFLLLYSGWWFQPLRKILVSWGYYSQYMDK